MNSPQEATAAPTAPPPRPVARAIATFFIFAIAGPRLGLLMIITVAAFYWPDKIGNLVNNLPTIDLGRIPRLVMALGFFSYLFGGLQAAGVGLAAAIARYRSRPQRIPLSLVLFASFACGLVFFIIVLSRGSPRSQPSDLFIMLLAFVIGPHLVAGFGCWVITRLLVRSPLPSGIAT